jgi:hypothetical protein
LQPSSKPLEGWSKLQPFFGLPADIVNALLVEVTTGKKTLAAAGEEAKTLKAECAMAAAVDEVLSAKNFRSRFADVLRAESKKSLVEEFKGKCNMQSLILSVINSTMAIILYWEDDSHV